MVSSRRYRTISTLVNESYRALYAPCVLWKAASLKKRAGFIASCPIFSHDEVHIAAEERVAPFGV